jgi:hypothetical protein
MTDPSVSEGYGSDIAAELRRIADQFAYIAGAELPEPRYVHLHIQPGGKTDDEVIDAVDAFGLVLGGKPGEVRPMSSGNYHYETQVQRGPVVFKAYREISAERAARIGSDAVLAEKEAELTRLRVEVEKLRAERSGLSYTRADDADDPTPVSGARIAPHTGGLTDGGLVDETAGETGERIELGMSGCGCPITEEIRPNGSSIDGTTRAEHRPDCWNSAESGIDPDSSMEAHSDAETDPGPCWHGEIRSGFECPGTGPDCGPA